MTLLLAIILGLLFGFVLQRVGAADPQKIVGMLTLTDLHLLRTILFAVGLSSTILFLGLTIGVIEAGNLSVKAMYGGVIVGGILLGAGWAIAGFCPGTGLVAAGAGRRDALVFVLGGLVGAGLFTALYAPLAKLGLFESLLGGETALAGPDSGVWLAVIIGVVMMAIAAMLGSRLRA